MITLYTFGMVPPFAMGLVRDLRVRWAAEEAGIPYQTRFVNEDISPETYRALQPFGQVPAIEDDGLELFESGAIALHIADKGNALTPADTATRAHVLQWTIAALNSIEPHVQHLVVLDLFYAEEAWAKARRPGALAFVETRLSELEAALGEREWLAGPFSVADILMVTVLRLLRHTQILDAYPRLKAYQARSEARPAFVKALADHMAVFEREAVAEPA